MSDPGCETCSICGGDDSDCFHCDNCGSPICKSCADAGEQCTCQDADYDDDDDYDDNSMFQDPGGRSSLRAATKDNPRNLPCPTCGAENRLTPLDKQLGYQCDECADRAEGRGD